MPTDLDGLRNRVARRATRGWSPREGDNLVRILPHTSKYFTESPADIAIEFHSHFMKAEGSDTEVLRCLRDKREKCAICETIKKYKESADPVLKKVLEQIRSSERHLFNIVNLNDMAAGIQAYESGPKLYDEVMGFIANPAWGDMVSPKDGRNWTIHMTPQGKSRSGYQEYKLQPHPEKTDITVHLPTGWVETIDNLETSVASYPDEATVLRWLDVFGLLTPTIAAPVPDPPSAVPTTVAIPPAPPAAVVAPVPLAVAAPVPIAPDAQTAGVPGSPVSVFVASNPTSIDGTLPITITTKKNKEVPSCFSDGPSNKAIGYNPSKWPCTAGCPLKADCQLISLGLA